MAAARINHTATLLLNGQLLVTGGNEDPGSAEVYDPVSESWTRTKNLSPSRARHTATLLPNGQVLVAGGQALPRYGILARAQLYTSAPLSGRHSIAPRGDRSLKLLVRSLARANSCYAVQLGAAFGSIAVLLRFSSRVVNVTAFDRLIGRNSNSLQGTTVNVRSLPSPPE